MSKPKHQTKIPQSNWAVVIIKMTTEMWTVPGLIKVLKPSSNATSRTRARVSGETL